MTWSSIVAFLEFCVTSFPLPLALLVLAIGFWVFWYFKIRPQDKAKEEARDEAYRKQGDEFLEAMTQCKENFQHTVSMYEKALDNSTKAIENNTAAMNMMSLEMKYLRKQTEGQEKYLDKIDAECKRGNENMAKALVMLRDRD